MANVGCLPVYIQEEFKFFLCRGRQWLVQKCVKCLKILGFMKKILWAVITSGNVLSKGIRYMYIYLTFTYVSMCIYIYGYDICIFCLYDIFT